MLSKGDLGSSQQDSIKEVKRLRERNQTEVSTTKYKYKILIIQNYESANQLRTEIL